MIAGVPSPDIVRIGVSVDMRPIITAYDWVPGFAKGLVRDLRVRWALEEVGQSYDVNYLKQGEQKRPGHRTRQPFGQVPTFREGELTLFESGAIVHHIASTRPGLMPDDPAERARVTGWLFAALNTVEPVIADLVNMMIFEADRPWAGPRRPVAEGYVRGRLTELAGQLGDRDWLVGDRFTVADLVMVTVLQILRATPLVGEHASLAAYVARGAARPAYQRALADQLAGFTGVPPQPGAG